MESFTSWNPLFDNSVVSPLLAFSPGFSFEQLPSLNKYPSADFLDMGLLSPDLTCSSPVNYAPYSKSPQNDSERSPSIGISLSPNDRPFSSADLKCFSAASSENRVDSAFDTINEEDAGTRETTPNTLVDLRIGEDDHNRESPVVPSIDDWADWREWGIKTASSCPPLDQLFENKKSWRQKFNASVPPPMQRHCVFCRSMKKPPHEFLSHNVRDETGAVTCPVLKIYRCPNCGNKGHTVRYCLKPQTVILPRNNASRNKPRNQPEQSYRSTSSTFFYRKNY